MSLTCCSRRAAEYADYRQQRGEEDEDHLALYDARRRPINVKYVQEQTIANKKRLEAKDPNARAENFAFLRRTAADAGAHRAFLLRTSLLESVRHG